LMIIYVISLGLMTGIFNGSVPNTDINMYAFLYVSFIEMSFFSLILANRINESRLQTIKIQNELLEQKNINARELEEMVKDRTKELEILQEQLKIQANRDPLTELYNRRYFSNIAKKSFNIANRYEQKLSILMLDLDYFKSVNDTYGHGTGDDVLVAISQKLRELSRDADIVARYGGEEFILLLPRTSLQDARVLAQRICDEIRMIRVAISDDNSIKTTVSIGVSELSKKDENIDQLISRADIKLYEAKENGRNGVCI
ncbi:MAG TPA: GGDEF domain-containing protein, partial [Sulfurimonas sp.]|nr:GGDEF domain-containing protein [Sulfurimonas sp.]